MVPTGWVESSSSFSSIDRWNPPRSGIFKVNFDGAIFEQKHAIGVGIVIRDDKAFFAAGMSRKLFAQNDAKTAETMAATEALSRTRLSRNNIGRRFLDGHEKLSFKPTCQSSLTSSEPDRRRTYHLLSLDLVDWKP
ncbi:unnamed protein product [Ilex paraguariensis]|uniref:RNase H type-1 domain-containing protein n=1 Tax=Ilex paraguariensis TaxID=185542 RepID=A0ABC8S6Y3_9AQUA